MSVSVTSLRIAMIVIIVVAVLIIIEASWSLQTINSTAGDACNCSGVSTDQLNSLRTLEIIMLLVGIGIAVYAVVMLILPTSKARAEAGERIRERFKRKET